MRPAPRHGPRGFTLVELLTVIAVIGILAAILISVVSAVRLGATKTTSLSNLRQIGVAFSLFAQDHRGFLPGAGNGPSNRWHGQLAGYLIKVPGNYGYRSPILHSPLTPREAYDFAPEGSAHGMYGYNDLLSLRASPPVDPLLGVRRSAILRPALTVLAAGKNWRSHETGEGSGPQLNPLAPYPQQPHGAAANYRSDRDPAASTSGAGDAAYLFCDGHVAMLEAWPGAGAFLPEPLAP